MVVPGRTAGATDESIVREVNRWRRASSHSAFFRLWHLGQCRSRHELYEMRTCPQLSQQSLCPPSAAVRHAAMCLMTASWAAEIAWTRRYCAAWARMPEPHMATLAGQVEGLVWELTRSRTFREVVLVCDGKPSLWKDLQSMPTYDSATKILDFYHAVEHLSRAAEALFGKSTPEARRWYERYRHRLLHDEHGVDSTLRSLRYYAKGLRAGSDRAKSVRRVIRHFGANRDRMRYATFRKRGLPIGSGPVEAACKTVVGNRLKRSGMRWSHDGGQNVLNLRTAVKSNRWDTLWSVYQGSALRQAA